MKKYIKWSLVFLILLGILCILIISIYIQRSNSDSINYYNDICNSTSYIKEIRNIACGIMNQYKNSERTDSAKIFNTNNPDLIVFQYNYYNYPPNTRLPSCCGVSQQLYFQYKNKYLGSIDNDNTDFANKISLQENDKYIYFFINTGSTVDRDRIFIINKETNKVSYYYIDIPIQGGCGPVNCDAVFLHYDDVKFNFNTYQVDFYKDNNLIFQANKTSDFEVHNL